MKRKVERRKNIERLPKIPFGMEYQIQLETFEKHFKSIPFDKAKEIARDIAEIASNPWMSEAEVFAGIRDIYKEKVLPNISNEGEKQKAEISIRSMETEYGRAITEESLKEISETGKARLKRRRKPELR